MGYFYGAVLLASAIAELRRRDRLGGKSLVLLLTPAAITEGILAAALWANFGFWALVSTILPLKGAAVYHANGFGFFHGVGRHFWYFPGVRIGYYLGTGAGFWLIGTAVLLLYAIGSAYRLATAAYPTDRERLRDEVILTCALLHAAFVCLFYGSTASWMYYVFIPVIGLAEISRMAPRAGTIVLLLSAIALLGNKDFLVSSIHRWRTQTRVADSGWLWAPKDELSEWTDVLRLINGGEATLITPICGGELLFPQFQPPVAAFLVPGQALMAEINAKASQVESARFAVAPTPDAFGGPFQIFDWWPQIRNALGGMKAVYRGRYFVLYERGGSGRTGESEAHGLGMAKTLN